MALPRGSTRPSLFYSLQNVQNITDTAWATATNAVATMTAGPVDSTYVFKLLDDLRSIINTLNTSKNVAGLDAYTNAQVPGYALSLVSDITATQAAVQSVIDLIVSIFPKDSTGTYPLAEILNADGSRTTRSFPANQLGSVRTALNNLAATIG